MNRARFLTLGAVAATAFATSFSYNPVWRAASKLPNHEYAMMTRFYRAEGLPSLTAGLAIIVLAVFLAERRPVIAVIAMISAPLVAFATPPILWALR